MPTTFLDRERAFEAKFAHDEELRFLALARRDKLFGRWAATTLKSSKEEGDALVKTVLTIADGPGHDLALLGYIADRLSARGWGFEGSLPEVLGRCMQDARAQLGEKPPEYSNLR